MANYEAAHNTKLQENNTIAVPFGNFVVRSTVINVNIYHVSLLYCYFCLIVNAS